MATSSRLVYMDRADHCAVDGHVVCELWSRGVDVSVFLDLLVRGAFQKCKGAL